jgi:type IV secretory pathway VirB10-like protein
LRDQSESMPIDSLINPTRGNVADELASLPKDYAGIPHDVPRLGPPLPGDLGRPIVAAQSSAPSSLAIDTEQQRVNQETEAARTSKVFANTNVRPLRHRPVRRLQTQQRPPMRHFLKMARTENSRSSTRPPIGGRQAPTAW